MAYLGRQASKTALDANDIPDNSITTAKIVDDNVTAAKIPAGAVSSDVVYLENNTSTQDLSGTYSTERVYFNDSYQLTGDVTVTGHLALGSIADEDIVITQDSTERTITGSGTLEAGNVLQDTHRTSLTGMTGELGSGVTGELGSGVTGSPNLNLTTGSIGTGVNVSKLSFNAYLAVSADIPSSSWQEPTKYGQWAERFNSESVFSQGRYKPGVAGIYHIGYGFYMAGLDAGEVIGSLFAKNADTDGGLTAGNLYGFEMMLSYTTDRSVGSSGSSIINLGASDYISWWIEHTEGAPMPLNTSYTEIWGFRVGTT